MWENAKWTYTRSAKLIRQPHDCVLSDHAFSLGATGFGADGLPFSDMDFPAGRHCSY